MRKVARQDGRIHFHVARLVATLAHTWHPLGMVSREVFVRIGQTDWSHHFAKAIVVELAPKARKLVDLKVLWQRDQAERVHVCDFESHSVLCPTYDVSIAVGDHVA